MSVWNEDRLSALIALPQEEDTRHEYKSAESLRFSEESRKSEFRKDVSAMANSAGGTIVYGMVERKDGSRVVPDHLESVDSIGTTKETLYQVLDSVQRRIDGVKIESVDLTSSGYVYVVEVPESNTIHMCEGGSLKYAGKYFTRRGNRVSVMEDHEVRMGLNRSVHPNLEVDFRWGRTPVANFWESNLISGERLTCIVRHNGGPLTEKISLEIVRPRYWTDDPSRQLDGGLTPVEDIYSNYLSSKSIWIPLFPQKSFEFHLQLRPDFRQNSRGSYSDDELLQWSVFADSALPRRGEIRRKEIRHETFDPSGKRI